MARGRFRYKRISTRKVASLWSGKRRWLAASQNTTGRSVELFGSREAHQPSANGVKHESGSGANPERLQDVGPVDPYRVRTDAQQSSNLPIRFSPANETQHFEFTGGERTGGRPGERARQLDAGIKDFSPGGDFAHRLRQFQIRRALQKVSLCTRIESRANVKQI